MRIANADNIAKYREALNSLITTENLSVKRSYFVQNLGLLPTTDGLRPVADYPRISQFESGRIIYEDGYEWSRNKINKDEWKLSRMDSDGARITAVDATVSDGAIKKIAMHAPHQRQPKSVRSHIMDLMDIVHDLNTP